MHSVRVLLDLVPKLLVEQRGVSRPRNSAAELPMACGFARREEGRAETCAGQQHECLPMPYHFELLENLPEGLEPRVGYCRDQERVSILGEVCESWDGMGCIMLLVGRRHMASKLAASDGSDTLLRMSVV